MSTHLYRDGSGRLYADTVVLNSVSGTADCTLHHMGFGEFYAETPCGRVDFDRMRGADVTWETMSGRSHLVQGSQAAIDCLLDALGDSICE